ncbi:hypothetical protein BJX96DRAFT_155266 [Aspergillus floccosus]
MCSAKRSQVDTLGLQCNGNCPRRLRCLEKGTNTKDDHANPPQKQARSVTRQSTRNHSIRRTRRPVNTHRALIPYLSIDEAVVPNLPYEALTSQTKEAFHGFLLYYFPTMYSSISSRVDVNWMDFLRHQQSAPPEIVMWAVRALVTYQMGVLQNNEQALFCARHMYSRAITQLAWILGTPSALSDSTLAAAIMLCVYEMMDGDCKTSWLIHSQGIRHLLVARGPSAHMAGMGQNLLVSYRPFLIADALTRAEPCLLAEPHWALASKCTLYADVGSRTDGLLGQTIDDAFNECAKCPGYYAATRRMLITYPGADISAAQSLRKDITRTKGRLVQLQNSLQPAFDSTEPPATFVGPIPSMDAARLAGLTSEGISSAVALLDQLLGLLRPYLDRSLCRNETGGVVDPWRAAAEKAIPSMPSIQSPLPASGTCATGSQLELDKFSVAMGMINISRSVDGGVSK